MVKLAPKEFFKAWQKKLHRWQLGGHRHQSCSVHRSRWSICLIQGQPAAHHFQQTLARRPSPASEPGTSTLPRPSTGYTRRTNQNKKSWLDVYLTMGNRANPAERMHVNEKMLINQCPMGKNASSSTLMKTMIRPWHHVVSQVAEGLLEKLKRRAGLARKNAMQTLPRQETIVKLLKRNMLSHGWLYMLQTWGCMRICIPANYMHIENTTDNLRCTCLCSSCRNTNQHTCLCLATLGTSGL